MDKETSHKLIQYIQKLIQFSSFNKKSNYSISAAPLYYVIFDVHIVALHFKLITQEEQLQATRATSEIM